MIRPACCESHYQRLLPSLLEPEFLVPAESSSVSCHCKSQSQLNSRDGRDKIPGDRPTSVLGWVFDPGLVIKMLLQAAVITFLAV